MEGMYGTSDKLSFDFFAPFTALKPHFIKYCKAFEKRLTQSVPFHRVIPVNEELPTSLAVAGFITDRKSGKGKNALHPITLELQFLHHHVKQFTDIHRELMRIEYTPQSETALTNLKILLLLEISLLLGCDVEWAPPSGTTDIDSGGAATSADGAGSGPVSGPVLTVSGRDDDDESSEGDVGADNSTEQAAEKETEDTHLRRGGARSAKAAPGTKVAAGAKATAGVPAAPGAPVLDVDDFTTWAPETWAFLDFDKISFDPSANIQTVRSYLAIAMIFWYEPRMRTEQPRVWGELNAAWTNTFSSDLHPHVLEKWPEKGDHAFNESQSKWLFETLRYLKNSTGKPALRRRNAPPSLPAIAKLTHVVRPSSKKPECGGGNTKKRRSDDPVRASARFRILFLNSYNLFHIIYCYYADAHYLIVYVLLLLYLLLQLF
jgi:hypothetical protein